MSGRDILERQLKGENVTWNETLKARKDRRLNYGISKESYPSLFFPGVEIYLDNAEVFIDNITKKVYTNVSGKFYTFDGIMINKRIRIVKNKENVGNLDKRVAWVNIDDVKLDREED